METLPHFQRLAQRALDHSINLNDRVDRDESFRSLHGGHAIVYKGTINPEGTQVAVKSLRLSPSANSAATNHIVEEIRRWTTLQHNNVVSVFGVVTKFEFTVSIISEWIPKGNAYDYVQDVNNDPRPLLLGIARGLHYLHSHGLLHGNLRAHNVLISTDGQPLLVDYGLSALIDSSFSMRAGAPIYPTIKWMAPEQVDNYGKVTTQADVWAFGMTAVELFIREPPYHDIRGTRGAKRYISQGPPNRPTDEITCGRMTDEWWGICCLCWKPDEPSRPPISDIIEKVEVSSKTKFFRMPVYATLFTMYSLPLLCLLIHVTSTP
ncbi:hypothetical protein SCLCIDRAFT_1206733 [Scleroderma citrinum Foug A]|uniref:Protein kinase domain-containing protein n=1 Tax=Scleroderma citrinum Foug A TaxID=1036808 RepID=A0A0C3ES46_9AGAM|nr:hypothetical protein SCLCIDRAFT_1206733 [Scleroderma citrinum Foug A]